MTFGEDNPRDMPRHLFWGVVRMDYQTAVRSNPDKQNCSICPRYWYVDAFFLCDRCGSEFVFSAGEQRLWYEQYGFWVDSIPRHCVSCRRELRDLKAARREYDANVERVLERGDLESRKQLARVIDQLYELGSPLPPQITENRRRLAKQIAGAERKDDGQ
jgi:hypothetical protein